MSTSRAMAGGWVDRKAVPRGPNGRGPRGRFTFCSEFCVHEWKLRSQPAYLREKVLLRDRGICANCRVDTLSAYRRLRRSRAGARKSQLEHWGLKKHSRKSLWDADHIQPVAEGGGECDLANIRTLCLRCHRTTTSELRERLRLKKMLQAECSQRPVPASSAFPMGSSAEL